LNFHVLTVTKLNYFVGVISFVEALIGEPHRQCKYGKNYY